MMMINKQSIPRKRGLGIARREVRTKKEIRLRGWFWKNYGGTCC